MVEETEEYEKIEDEDEKCEPCYYDAIIGGAFIICKRNTNTKSDECDIVHEKYLLGESTIDDYLDRVLDLVKHDENAYYTIIEMKKIAKEKHMR